MSHLLEDVSLAGLTFISGRELRLDFINLSGGRKIAGITATGIVLLNFRNAFSDDQDGFPVYVGEVTCREVVADQRGAALVALGYGFTAAGGEPFTPDWQTCFHIHVEGGEIELDIVCNTYRIDRL